MDQPPVLEDIDEEEGIDLIEEPQLMEIEAMMEVLKKRLYENPSMLVDTIHDWLEEEYPLNF